MTISLAGLDMPVLVPAGVPPRSLSLLAAARGTAAPGAPSWWEDVSVGPVPPPGTPPDAPPAWSVRTIARRGCRPDADGGWTVDGSLRGVAETAVTSMLLKLIPHAASAEDTLRWTQQASATGRAVAARLDDVRSWPRTTMDVDGHPFVLWLHQRAEGFAGVADLGACRVVLHGRRPPPAWRFTLLPAATARTALGT
jgi:hypothetical protein